MQGPLPNPVSPSAQTRVDPITGGGPRFGVTYQTIVLLTNTTTVTTTMTTTRSGLGGVFYGVKVRPSGSVQAAAVDVVGTKTYALTGTRTFAAGGILSPSPQNVGLRFLGTLIILGVGTTSALDVYWQ